MTSHRKEGTPPNPDSGQKDDAESPLKNSDLDHVIISPASEAALDPEKI